MWELGIYKVSGIKDLMEKSHSYLIKCDPLWHFHCHKVKQVLADTTVDYYISFIIIVSFLSHSGEKKYLLTCLLSSPSSFLCSEAENAYEKTDSFLSMLQCVNTCTHTYSTHTHMVSSVLETVTRNLFTLHAFKSSGEI